MIAAMSAQSRAARFARNVGSSFMGQAALALLSFAAAPYLVHRLGLEAYGLYVLLQTTANYLQLGSFGSGTATTKYVAELSASANDRALKRVLELAAGFHVAGPLVAGALVCVFARFVAFRIFHVPAELLETGIFVMRCAGAAAVFVSLCQLASAVTQGLQRFGLYSAWNVLLNAGLLAGAVGAVHYGFGVKGIAAWFVLWNAFIALGWLGLLAAGLGSTLGADAGDFSAGRFSRYSFGMWGGALAWIVTFQFDRIFLARGASLTAVSLYAVPSGLLQRLQLVPALLGTVLMPMFSEIHGGDSADTLRRAYLKGTRLTLFAALGPLVGLFALMPQFLSLWLGGHFGDQSVWPARLLVVAQAFFVLQFVPNALAQASAKPLYVSGVAWAQALISLVAWRLLVPRYQLLGVAGGSLLAQLVPALVYVAVVNRRALALGPRRYLEEGVSHAALAAAALLAFVFPLHALASTWPRLIALSAAGAALYASLVWRLSEPVDRELALRLIPALGQRK